MTGREVRNTTGQRDADQWQAITLFGQHNQIFGWSATELLDELTEHRARNQPGE